MRHESMLPCIIAPAACGLKFLAQSWLKANGYAGSGIVGLKIINKFHIAEPTG